MIRNNRALRLGWLRRKRWLKRNRKWLPTIVGCLWAGTLLAISFTPIVTGDFLTRHLQSIDADASGLDDSFTYKQHEVGRERRHVSAMAKGSHRGALQTARDAKLNRRHEDRLHVPPYAGPVPGNPPLDIPFDMTATAEHAERRFAYGFKAQSPSHKALSAATSRSDLLDVEDDAELEPGDIVMRGGFAPMLSLDRAPKDAKFELIR